MVFSKKTNVTRQTSNSTASHSKVSGSKVSNNPMMPRIMALGLAASLAITGCSKVEEPTAEDETTEQPLAKNPETEQAVIGKGRGDNSHSQEHAQSADDGDASTKPVSYDVKNWEASDQTLEIDDLEALKSLFGTVTVTDENSLDYASNTAVKYRFMTGEQPYLDIIDSDKYLEFGWYYANPGDSDSEKEMSINHAKKVYKAATALMGDKGAQLVTSILSGQVVKKKDVADKKVELAKCEFYSCMLILKKNS